MKNKVDIIAFDLSDTDNCYKLYDKVKKMKVDIIVNNAGFINFKIALSKGKHEYDKREVIKKRDLERENRNFK